jgi:hypothetical protein
MPRQLHRHRPGYIGSLEIPNRRAPEVMRDPFRHPRQSTSLLPSPIQRFSMNRLDGAPIVPKEHPGHRLPGLQFNGQGLFPLRPQDVSQLRQHLEWESHKRELGCLRNIALEARREPPM